MTALDIDASSLLVAEERCRLYGCDGLTFRVGDAARLTELFDEEQFDFVVFYASLEHMTQDERTIAISSSWRLVRPGGYWAVVEAPNRLWFFDSHTSCLPFFYWLPDDVAAQYMRYSPREKMRDRFRELEADAAGRLARSGRGVSYHELQLALDEMHIQVVSDLASFTRRRSPIVLLNWLLTERRYASLLKKQARGVPSAFFEPYLDVLICKPT